MDEKNSKRIPFERACEFTNERGRFMVGKDGTVLVESLSAISGEHTMVVLARNEEDLGMLISFLHHCFEDHPFKPKSVLDPDLAQMLHINTTKH